MSVIDDLLAFDDQPELLDFRFEFGSTLALPAVRWNLCYLAANKVFGWQASHAEREPLRLRERADFWWRSLRENPLRVDRTFDLIIFGSSAGIALQEQGRWFDRINDYFAAEYPERTLVVDAAYRGRYKHPRFPPHVRCRDGFSLWAAARGRMKPPAAADQSMARRLIQFLRERFPVPLDDGVYERLSDELVGVARQLPHLHALYHRFFDRTRPKILFAEDGSYGGLGPVLAWARAAGIATAEFQHGLIAPSHLAYNYGDGLRRNSEFATYLPRSVLVYGDYWLDQLRTPSEKVVIGWPHFERRAAEHRARARAADPEVLIVSQGTMTGRLVALTEELARRFPRRRFAFRLHPGEVPFAERYASLSAHSNVRVSHGGDIYDCFAGASVVIGHSSTALVEAVGLGLPAFIVDDAGSRLLVPPGLGTFFVTADQLSDLLSRSDATPPQPERFTSRDWRARFRAFVERVAA